MKKSIILTLGITTALGFNSAHALTLYCVHDKDLNDSQFCQGTPFGPSSKTPTIQPDGNIHHDCDIEALDVRFDPAGTIYAASGDDTPRPGHLYRVEAPGGNLYDLGPVYNEKTGGRMMEIDAISVLPSTGEIWGWSQGQGLFVIDPDKITHQGEPVDDCTALPPDGQMAMDDPELSPDPIPAQEEIPAPSGEPIEIEDLEWNFGGTILYGVANDHCGHGVDSHGEDENNAASDRDYDCGITLWAYFKDQQEDKFIAPVCTDLLDKIKTAFGDDPDLKDGIEIEGLEALSRTFLGKPTTTDTLVLAFHGAYKLRYVVINKPKLPLSGTCTLVASGEVITSEVNDIEGVGVSPEIDFSSSGISGNMVTIAPDDQGGITPGEAEAEWAALLQEAMEETPNNWEEELPEELLQPSGP